MTTTQHGLWSQRGLRLAAIVYTIILFAMVALGYWYYSFTKQHIRREKEELLGVIAELKVRQLLQWRYEATLEVEREVAENGLHKAVEKVMADPVNQDNRKSLRECLDREATGRGEPSPQLFDTNGSLLASTTDSTPPADAATIKAVNHALETKKFAFSDFFLTPDHHVDVDIVDTVRDAQGQILAVLVQPQHVGTQIGPIVQSWPILTQVGAIFLVERVGDQLVYLNELERQNNVLLKSPQQNRETKDPDAKAVLSRMGLSWGKDSHGVEVLSYLLPVRGTPWVLMAKMDASEIASDAGYRTTLLCMAVGLFVLLIGVLTAYLIRLRQNGMLGRIIEAEREKNQALIRYQDILMASMDGYVLVDMEGHIKEVNEAYCRLSGYSAQELLSMNHADLEALETQDQLAVHRQKILATGSDCFESQHRRKNGTIVDVEVKVQCRTSEKMIAAFVRDISERNATEARIKWLAKLNNALGECNDIVLHSNSEEHLFQNICRIVVDQGDMRMAWIGIVDKATSKVVPVASYGHRNEEYASELDVFLKEDSTLRRGPVGISIRENRPVWHDDLLAVEDYKPWRDRVTRYGWNVFAAFPLRRNGKPVGSLNVFGNKSMPFNNESISLFTRIADNVSFALDKFDRMRERAQTIEQLRDQAELLDAASDGIILKDMEGRIIYWNHGAESIYGWSSDEILGRTSKDTIILHPKEFDHASSELLKNGIWRGEMEKKTKDGRNLVVETRWNLVRDASGKPKGVLSINTDVTEHKKLESQFFRMQKLESIGTLANGIAHDLNNTLAPILMALELLDSYVSESAARELIETMRQSAQHGADLVKQVLSFARGVDGQRLSVRLEDVWQGIEKVIRDTFPKNITFSLKSTSGLYSIDGDSTQLQQVFMNLCVNARDAMPNGGALTISMENIVLDDVYAGLNPIAKAGSYVVVQVMDNGIGIPKDIQERIFDPFFTTKEQGSGTGVGLFTVATIVKNHGGFINLYSEEGRGSTFKVYLPADKFGKPASKSTPKKGAPERGHGETILLVDDEERVLKVAEKVLTNAGYHVLTAGNGAEALAHYAQHREKISVVMTDMAMPVMDGLATISALKAMNPDVKIIASSGLMSHTFIASIEKLGVKHLVPKPYTAEIMLEVLAEAIKETKEIKKKT